MRRPTEGQLQKAVIETAERLGWRVCHFGSSVKVVKSRQGGYATIPDKQAAGFPDLVMVKPPRLMFVELKGHSAVISDEQIGWLGDLTKVANHINALIAPTGTTQLEVYIWRPNDWESGVIERRLK